MEENSTTTSSENSETQKGNNGLIIGIVVLLIVGAGAYFVFGAGKKSNQPSSAGTAQVATTSPETSQDPNVKTFTVEGSSFAYNPATITVNKGDSVKITFKDIDSKHNLIIDGYNVSTDIIGTGKTDTIEFIADKTGTFKYYCSLPGHEAQGMTGKLIVQ